MAPPSVFHGMGIFVFLALTNNGKDAFDCTPGIAIPFTEEITYDYMKSETVIRAGILMLMIKVFSVTGVCASRSDGQSSLQLENRY